MKIEEPIKTYSKDKRLVYSCQYHIIFCPKFRRPVLVDDIAVRLKQLILDKQSDFEYTVIEVEVMNDHVHLILDVNPKIGVYRVVSKIKGYTSRILRQEFPKLKSRLPTLWTLSRFMSTVGSVSLESVKEYVKNQRNQ